MTTFQLIMVILMAVAFVCIIGFSIAFIVEAAKAGKVAEQKAEEPAEEEKAEEPAKEESYDIRDMLAQLEEEAATEPPATTAKVTSTKTRTTSVKTSSKNATTTSR